MEADYRQPRSRRARYFDSVTCSHKGGTHTLSILAGGELPAAMIKTNGVMKIEEIIRNEPPPLLILYDYGQEEITSVVADVLGRSYCLAGSLEVAKSRSDREIIGLENDAVTEPESLRNMDRTLITTHCVGTHDLRKKLLTTICDFEYLYTSISHCQRDLARFLGFVLGQTMPHEDLKRKQRTTVLSTTVFDVRESLPNLEILSTGADAVELRVDLLRDPATEREFGSVPGLKYVGEQVMLLRQRTELPIIFTTRCTKDNGRFPMDNSELFYKYLRKAVQWGCEYIDVELWLPKEIRRKLSNEKGHSKIISAWHDFSGQFKWTSPEAGRLFKEGAVYGDIVKMVALANQTEENHELECFRSNIQSTSNPPFSGFNVGNVGQLSKTLNKVFTPITHPLLSSTVSSSQLSAAEINSTLFSMGQKPRPKLYAIGHLHSNGLPLFFKKCLNELSQPYQLVSVERVANGTIEHFLDTPQFGGAFLNPPLPVDVAPYLPTLTEAASQIGQVDTIAVRSTADGGTLIADNVTWKGIRATLTQEFVPSAYAGRSALILGHSEAQAAASIYALHNLDVGGIYSVGFSAPSTVQLHGLEDMKRAESPFLIISALPAEKSFISTLILKHYRPRGNSAGRVFVDLSNGIGGKTNLVSLAASLGWASYAVADVNAGAIVETIQLLVGENVPRELVQLAAGPGLYK